MEVMNEITAAYRTHNNGELRAAHIGNRVKLSGWVQKVRDKGGMMWIDLRDRYGVTQLVLEEGKTSTAVIEAAKSLGREFVITIEGEVIERYAKNDKIPTGEVEVFVSNIEVINKSETPPFTIEDESDGGDEIRMKYRYLDLRRNPVKKKIMLRHKVAQATRSYLSGKDFLEIETPFLIKSTPEGARDFVVPSRMNENEFYALPQSPQSFKQLLMVSGFEKYFQIVKCFRDEDLRADRQPEFTQIDCEMSFVTQEDILNTFEGLTKHLFKTLRGVELPDFIRMPFAEAMEKYGVDKPDIRFGMEFVDFAPVSKNKGFNVFDQSEVVIGINAKGCADYTRKQLDKLTDFAKSQQVGARGMVYVKCNTDGTFKSSVDKFYTQEDLAEWAKAADAAAGDLLLLLSGDKDATRKQLGVLRLHMGDELGLRDTNVFKPMWVVDFPMVEWDEDSERWHAMHHPFTSPKAEDMHKLETDLGAVNADAYDLVINGVEIGGGSIRIHDKDKQALVFKALGLTDEEAREKFGFLLDAFEYGAPPHGGIAFGFDRLCAMFGGSESIRDYIAFPKNNQGRDTMLNAPSKVDAEQLEELRLALK